MQEELLTKILSEVKTISGKVENLERTTAKAEDLEKLSNKVNNLEAKVDNLEGKVDNLENKVDNLEGKVENIEKTMVTSTEFNDFKEEVYALFDKNTKEIANEIRELSVSISKKMHQEHQAIRNEMQRAIEINQKDHEIFKAQIEKLQITNQYLESKIHI